MRRNRLSAMDVKMASQQSPANPTQQQARISSTQQQPKTPADWTVLSQQAQVAGVVVSFFVAGVVLWYTLETRKLRMQAQAQIDLLRKQSESGTAQLKLLQEQAQHSSQQLELAKEQSRIDQLPYVEMEADIPADRDQAVEEIKCRLRNRTNRICHHVFVVVGQQGTREWTLYSNRRVVDLLVGEIDVQARRFSGLSLLDDALDYIAIYGGEKSKLALRNYISAGLFGHFVAAIFRDVNNRLYLTAAQLSPEPFEKDRVFYTPTFTVLLEDKSGPLTVDSAGNLVGL